MCEYCDGPREPINKMDVTGITARTCITGDGWLRVKVDTRGKMAYQEAEINYCPKCGRSLRGEGE